MDGFLRSMHEARENGLDELDRKIRGHESTLVNQAEVIRKQAATIVEDGRRFDLWMERFGLIEEELRLIQGQVASLQDTACRCGSADAAERVPSPVLSYAGSLQSYHTPPIASPRENEVPIPIREMSVMALDSEEENRPPIGVEDADEADEAEEFLRMVEIQHHYDRAIEAQGNVVRPRARTPRRRTDPYPHRMALGDRTARTRAEDSRRERRRRERSRRDRGSSTRDPLSYPSLEYLLQLDDGSPPPGDYVAARRSSGSSARHPSWTGNTRLGSPSWSVGRRERNRAELEAGVVDSTVGRRGGQHDGSPVA